MPSGDPPPPPEPLAPFAYQRDVLAYLETEERELWDWYSSDRVRAEYADGVRLDLLKSTYRLERDAHPDLYRLADTARRGLGLEIPVTLYQAQAGSGLNAALFYVPGEAHLVLVGPVAATLSADEVVAVLAHELAHYVFLHGWDGKFHVADQILLAMADHARAEPSHRQTSRRYRLYTELFADRGSLMVTGSALVSIAGLVKIGTGVKDASAESYLRQADEILAKSPGGAEGLSHPEMFVRARALRLWAAEGAAAGPEIARMLEGPAVLETLDLLGQRRLVERSRRLLAQLLAPAWFHTPAVLAHARLFFEGFEPEDVPPDAGLFEELAGPDPGLRDYLAYFLLDFVAADPDLEDAPLAEAFELGDRLALGDRLEELAAKELGLAKRKVAKIRKERVAILEAAAREPAS